MKKLAKIFFVFILVLLVFISFIPQLFHEKIEEITLKEIKAQIISDVSFKHLDISIWQNFPDLTISLKDVMITGKENTTDTLLKGKEIGIVIDIVEYLSDNHINLIKLSFDKPFINAWIAKDGQTNFLILKNNSKSRTDSTALSVHLRNIKFNNAFINYADQQNNTLVLLEDFNFKGSGEIGSETFDLKSEIKIANSTLMFNGKNYFKDKSIAINTLLSINSKENKYLIKESEISMNSLLLTATGEIEMKKDRIGLKLNFNTPEAELKDILSLASFFKKDMEGITTGGKVKLNGFATGYYVPGTDTIPQFRASLEISNGSFKVDTIADAIKNIHLDFAVLNKKGIIDSTQIMLDTLYCQLKEHIIQGHTHIHGLKNTEIDASLKGSIHIDEVLKVYPIKGINANGEITFDIKAEGKYNSIAGKLNLPQMDFDIDIANGYFKYDSLPEAISQINFHSIGHAVQGKLDDAEISISKLSLLMGADPVRGNIKVKGLINPTINGFIKAEMHLEDFKKFYPITGVDMKGALTIDAVLNGVYNSTAGIFPKIEAAISVKNAFVKTSNYPRPLENGNLDLKFANKTGLIADSKILIDLFKFELERDQFEMTGTIENFKDYAYDLKIKGLLDLGKITKIYPLEKITLSGSVDSDISLKGTINDLEKGNYEKTKANGTLTLKKLLINTDYLPKSIEVKSGLITLSPLAIILKDMDMDCGKSCFKISGQVKDYFCFFKDDGDLVEATLKLDADTIDLNEWKELFVSNGNQPSKTSELWKVPETIDFDFDSDLKYLRYEEMEIKNMKGELRIKDGVLSLTQTGFNALDALFYVGGRYDTRDVNHPLFDFDLDIQKLDIQKAYKGLQLIRDLAPAAAETEGIFSINYKIRGELDKQMNPKVETIVGGGELKIINAKINGMKLFDELGKAAKKKDMKDPHLKEFTLVSEIKNNKIYLKPFSLKVSGFHTEIEGENDINGPISYQIKVELLPIEKLKVPFNVSGTYDNPKVSLGKGSKLPEEPFTDTTNIKANEK